MDLQKEKLIELLTRIAPNHYVQALLIVIVSICFAMLSSFSLILRGQQRFFVLLHSRYSMI